MSDLNEMQQKLVELQTESEAIRCKIKELKAERELRNRIAHELKLAIRRAQQGKEAEDVQTAAEMGARG